MATNLEKTLVALILISTVFSAANLVVQLQLLGVSSQLSGISDKLSSIQAVSTANELFPNETDLYLKAKQEGSLIVYTVWDQPVITRLLAGFSERYPGMTTTYYEASNPDLISKVQLEFSGGQRTVDVISSDAVAPAVRSLGAIANYTTVQLDQCLVQDPNVPFTDAYIEMLAFNTQVLSRLNLTAPQNWEDVIDPTYKGLVALDDPLRGGPGTQTLAMLREYWNNETRFTNFVNGLKALNVPLYHSTGQMMRLVVAGEYAMGFPLLSNDVTNEQALGSPISYAKTIPAPLYSDYSALYALAPHPNAGKLFIEWCISIQGQLAFASLGYAPIRRGVPATTSVDVLMGTNSTVVTPSQEYLMDSTAYTYKYIRPIWGG